MATITNKEVIQTTDVFTGNVHAPVTIVCYIDYESVECASLNKVLNQLLHDFEDKIRVNIRHFPMAIKHQKAMKAAEAAVAAAQEGLFWPMNNILFDNQKALGTISLKQYAKEIGTQNKRFLEQVINGIFAWQVREDLLEGLDKGIRNVPAVFVNSELFGEDITLETLSKKVEEFL
ncbi:MAG: oxidoreductase [Segetibacter sp.]|nr:oxidoreductase [Segetibacter sp.]